MESFRDSPTTYVNRRVVKKVFTINDIIDEYTLKRNSFNPVTLSPNIFMTRLERRMELYYSNLYKSHSSKKK
jgi:hypothetical protein